MRYTSIVFLVGLWVNLFAQTWQSSKVQVGEDGCLTYPADDEKNRIPDFSYAGYQYGEVPLPIVETKITISPINGDNTAHIQNAINQVAAMPLNNSGFRGAVLLNPGLYEVYGTILINASGVVLKGSGDRDDSVNNTIIKAVGNTPHQRDVIIAGGNNNTNWQGEVTGTRKNITSDFVQIGENSFEVENASNLAVGDNIIIHHPCTQAWIDALDGGGSPNGTWNVNQFNIRFNRKIKAINGNTITIDVPVYNHLDKSLAQSYIYKYNRLGLLTHIGVENLRVDIEDSGIKENHAKNACVLRLIENAWVKNCTFLHFIYSGVVTYTANLVTVENCKAIEPKGVIDGGRFYNFNAERASNNILFKNCYANQGRHAYTSNGVTEVSGIVVYNCVSEDPYTSSEGHRHWSMAMLFDNFKDYGVLPNSGGGRVLAFYNRGAWGTNHGWSNAHSVAWNCDLRRTTGTHGKAVIQKPPTAQNYAIGCFGEITGDGPWEGTSGHIEGSNQSGLFPSSLYTAQLQCRLNKNSCLPAIASSNDGNLPTNVLDENLNTRWSANGEGEWLQLCIQNSDSLLLEGVNIAFFNGNQRFSTFDIQVSMDAENWKTVLTDAKSSGSTLDFEYFTFEPTWTKYFRYIGKGNNINKWNSITEINFNTLVTSTSKLEDDDLLIYPNPTTSDLNIKFKNNQEIKAWAELIDINGKVVLQFPYNSLSNFNVDVRNLTQGIYFVKLSAENFIKTQLWIKL